MSASASHDEGAEPGGEVRALVARHLPDWKIRSIARLGEGWDNVAYEVDGELVVRIIKDEDADGRSAFIRREAKLLEVLRELSTLPVPQLVFADEAAGALAYMKLPGIPLSDHRIREPAPLAAALGAFTAGLHRAPLAQLEKLLPREVEPLPVHLQDAEAHYREAAAALTVDARRLVEEFLARTPPAEPCTVAFCHNDLAAEHVLVDQETEAVTGVIDWTDAAIADPAHDLAGFYRDLGPELFELIAAAYRDQGCSFDAAARERAVFYARCALLDDLAYGVRTGERRYAEASLAHLARTFA